MKAEDYYSKFKPTAEAQVKSLAKEYKTLSGQYPKLAHRLERETDKLAMLEKRKKKLDEVATKSLSGDEVDYEKYRVSLKKLDVETSASIKMVNKMKTIVLPQADNKLRASNVRLEIKLDQMVMDSKSFCDTELDKILKALSETLSEYLAERERFLAAFEKIFGDYGLRFEIRKEHIPSRIDVNAIRQLSAKVYLALHPKVEITESLNQVEPKPKPKEAEPKQVVRYKNSICTGPLTDIR